MSNKAVITTEENFYNNGIGIYVHACGDPDSVQYWLEICKRSGYRKPEEDSYGWAYLVATIANFFGSGISVGIDTVDNLDCNNGDNGVYFIRDWNIVGGKYNEYENNLLKTVLNPGEIKELSTGNIVMSKETFNEYEEIAKRDARRRIKLYNEI